MNAKKSWFKRIRTFLRNRLLPHPVRIALFGNAESGKTTLLRSIDDRRAGYPLDDNAANRMYVGVSDQDVIDIPYRVFGRHGFRDFVVKDYKGVHFSATQFRSRVLEGAEGVVILVRGSRFVKDAKTAFELKSRYLEFCASLYDVRAVVLLEVAPDEVKDPESRKLIDGILDEFRKTIEDAGLPGKDIQRFSFQKPATDNVSLKGKRETAKSAAAPFLWLSEQLDRSLWTWIRTCWWTWMVLVSIIVALAATSLAFVVRGCGQPPRPDTQLQIKISEWKGVLKASVPKTETWSEWEEHRTEITNLLAWASFSDAYTVDGQFAEFVDGHKKTNDDLAIKLFAKDAADNIDWMSLVGKDDFEIVSFGKKLMSWTPLSQENGKEIDELRNRWSAVTKQIGSYPDSPSSEIVRTYRLLTSSRPSPQQKEEAKKKRQFALQSVLNQILERFKKDAQEPTVSKNGLPQNMETLLQCLFPEEAEFWKKTIASRRGDLIREQIEEWKNSTDLKSSPKDKSPDAGRLLRQYASFARLHSENPDFRLATDFVASVVGPKLIELAESLEKSLKERNPSGKTVQVGERALNDLRNLCSSIRGDLVQKTPFRDRWESRFAREFKEASFTDGHPREYEEMFRWRMTITGVKISAENTSKKFWVSLALVDALKWNTTTKKRDNDKNPKVDWLVKEPENWDKRLGSSNVGPGHVLRASCQKDIPYNPFDAPCFHLRIWTEFARTAHEHSEYFSGAEPFFKDKDDKGAACRKLTYYIDKKTKAEIQCWIYGAQKAIWPLRMLNDAKNNCETP